MEDEQEFIQKLLRPETQNQAFQELLRRYQRPLYSHIRNIVINHDDADDVLQNTFIKVFRHLKGFKGDSKLFSWIYRIGTNEALSFLSNKAKRNGHTGESLSSSIVENLRSDTYFNGDEIQFKLHLAVATLPPKQQLVFKMKYFEDLKYEEISDILGTSTGALKASYHHAVKKIEEYMSED